MKNEIYYSLENKNELVNFQGQEKKNLVKFKYQNNILLKKRL